jgi:hypothetical protein
MANVAKNLEGIDVAWLAMDSFGHIGVFTTGGKGPIPSTALPSVESAEESVALLPEVSGSELHARFPRPDDYVAFSKRGIFAFDWVDVHRVGAEASNAYELIASPTVPVKLEALPARVKALASATVFPNLAFTTSKAITLPEGGI